MLCLGDSIGHPSCAGAAAALADTYEIASFRVRGKLLNTMSSRRMRRCVGAWMGTTRWRLVAFNAGAWDLSTGHGACCDVGSATVDTTVSNLMRGVLTLILARADMALWITTTPVPETAACCRRWYAQPPQLPDAQLTVGYCNRDATAQNARVSEALRALPPHEAARVGVADTASAVNRRCGAHYTDCEIQSQTRGCNCHFEQASYAEVHGPAIAAAVRALASRAATNRTTTSARAAAAATRAALNSVALLPWRSIT